MGALQNFLLPRILPGRKGRPTGLEPGEVTPTEPSCTGVDAATDSTLKRRRRKTSERPAAPNLDFPLYAQGSGVHCGVKCGSGNTDEFRCW
jgi:hypothetical protein